MINTINAWDLNSDKLGFEKRHKSHIWLRHENQWNFYASSLKGTRKTINLDISRCLTSNLKANLRNCAMRDFVSICVTICKWALKNKIRSIFVKTTYITCEIPGSYSQKIWLSRPSSTVSELYNLWYLISIVWWCLICTAERKLSSVYKIKRWKIEDSSKWDQSRKAARMDQGVVSMFSLEMATAQLQRLFGTKSKVN